MAIPQNAESVPTYMVYRDTKPGEPFDPTSPLLFFPPKGSDELFDALRVAFPNVKTHSERMRDAMIQYLLEERQEEQLASPAATMDTMPTTWPSMSSDSNSTWSSPELLNFPTPGASFSNSPQLAPELTRQASVATSSQPSPSGPSLDQMTGVFCLSTSSQPKQRVRRKMTDAEKAEYRKRRIVKACDKCAKRKRKCPHNQAEMANVPNKTTTRGAKSSSKSATPPNTTLNQKTAPDSSMAVDSLAFDPSEFIAFDDFNMFEDPYPELDINDMINWNQNEFLTPNESPVQRDWTYGTQTEDFTLLDPRVPNHMDLNDMNLIPDFNSSGRLQTTDDLERFANVEDAHAFPGSGGLKHQGRRHDAQQQHSSNFGGTYDGSNGMLWEHLRTGQPEPQPEKPVPTHTAHVHDAESVALNGLNEPIIRPQEPCRQQASLPQTVLRLTGTAKAVKSFTRLLGDRSQSSSSISMSRVLDVLRDEDPGRNGHPTSRHTNGVPAHLQRARFQASPLHDIERRVAAQGDEARNVRSGPLRDVRDTGSRKKNALSLLGESSTPLTSTSVSVSRGSLMRSAAASSQGRPQQQPSAELGGKKPQVQQSSSVRRQTPSLGEGIPADVNSASQLFMARRRITPRVNTTASVNAVVPGKDELSFNRSNKAAIPTAQSVSRTVDAVRLDIRSNRGLPGEGNSQANGGAYPRLEVQATPVHTRPRNPTKSSSTGDTDHQHHGAGSTTTRAGASRGRIQLAAAASSTAQAVASGLQAYEERLSDHVRYRDHHGRNMLAVARLRANFTVTLVEGAYWIAIFGSFFMLAMALGITPSFALLAFVSIKENEVAAPWHQRCSTKNSSWLSTFASMQLGSTASSSRGRGNEKEKKNLGKGDLSSAWFSNLRYPSQLAPLGFVGA